MIHGLALCAGVGGMELGLRLALGERYRTACYVEREAYAAAILVARMEDEALDPAPVWDDLATFDGRPWRGAVDLIASGLPCQPYSQAGKRQGHADERALWPEFVRIVEEVEPAGIFLENVTPFLRHFSPVYDQLRGLGFNFAPPMFHTASESGAPHIRRRLFIFAAHPERPMLRLEPRNGWGTAGTQEAWTGRTGADASGTWQFNVRHQTIEHRCGDGCRTCGTPWAVESPVLRVADGPSGRVDQLRAIGNAVVPGVVDAAYSELSRLLGGEEER